MSKFTQYGLYLLAFLVPWQTRYIFSTGQLSLGPWEYGTLSLYGTDILVFILLLGTLLSRSGRRLERCYYPYYGLGLGLFLASLVAAVSAFDTSLALFSLVKLSSGLALFWIILHHNLERSKLYFSFLTGAVLQAWLGLWQFFNQEVVANKWLGIATQLAKEMGTSVVEVEAADGVWERWLRAYGGLSHPNILGGLLAIALLILISLIIKQKLDKKLRYEWLSYTALIILTAGLFFSLSRTAWLALGAGLLVLLSQNLKRIKELLLPMFLVILTAGLLLWSYSPLVFSRFGDLHRIEVRSIDERLNYLDNAQDLIKQYGVIGVGGSNYGLAVYQVLTDRQISYWYQPVHNVILLVWAELGLLGLLSLIGLLAWLLVTIFYSFQKKKQFTADYSLALWLALLILMTFDHWLWSLHVGQLLFWFCLGLIVTQQLAPAKLPAQPTAISQDQKPTATEPQLL